MFISFSLSLRIWVRGVSASLRNNIYDIVYIKHTAWALMGRIPSPPEEGPEIFRGGADGRNEVFVRFTEKRCADIAVYRTARAEGMASLHLPLTAHFR